MWRRRKPTPLTMAPPPTDMWYDEIVEKTDKYIVYAVITPRGERILWRAARTRALDPWAHLDAAAAEP